MFYIMPVSTRNIILVTQNGDLLAADRTTWLSQGNNTLITCFHDVVLSFNTQKQYFKWFLSEYIHAIYLRPLSRPVYRLTPVGLVKFRDGTVVQINCRRGHIGSFLISVVQLNISTQNSAVADLFRHALGSRCHCCGVIRCPSIVNTHVKAVNHLLTQTSWR